jgi:hypothetical protein
VAIVADAEMDHVQRRWTAGEPFDGVRIPFCRALEQRVRHRHLMDVVAGDGDAVEQAIMEHRDIAVRVPVRGNSLVDLEDVD